VPLQNALQSRVLIEQAKGVLAERLQIDTSRAFETLRRYSRSHNEHLSKVAEGVISGTVDITALAATSVAHPSAHRTRP
jgi:AmiR/NasT family two-component response regulator